MLMKKKILAIPIFICLVMIISRCLLQASFIKMGNKRYMIKAWSVEDGLPQNSILSLIQTSDGYIWIGTQLGLVRFDGLTTHIFNRWNTSALKSDKILSLYQDQSGTLWIGTDGGGVSRFKEGKWDFYTTDEGLNHNTVRAIAGDSNGNLWIGTDNGISLLETQTSSIKNFTVEDGLSGFSVTALTITADGTLWIGTGGSGLNRYKKNKFFPFPPNKSFYGRIINTIFEDSRGILWVGTDNGPLTLVQDQFQSDKNLAKLNRYSINSIMEDRNGAIWFGTDGEGLYSYHPSREKLVSITTQFGLPENFIYSLMEDREGNLWMGTYTSGLVRLKQTKIYSITTADGLPENKAHTVFYDKNGYLWAGLQRKGLVKVKIEENDTAEVKLYSQANGLPVNRVRALCLDSNNDLWLGLDGAGLVRKKKEEFQLIADASSLTSKEITTIFQDHSGYLWVGTTRGLNRITLTGSNLLFNKIDDGLHIRTITEDEDKNLLAGTKNGLFIIKNNGLQKVEKTSSYDILAIHRDREGSLWLGTNGRGFLRLKNGEITRINTDRGIPSNYIFSINEDTGGNLWMSSYQGVFKVFQSELGNLANEKDRFSSLLTLECYDEKEGMPSSECVRAGQPSAWKTPGKNRTEKLFIPTVKGIALFSLENETQSQLKKISPPVIIEKVIADNHSVSDLKSMTILPPETGIIEFYFAVLNFTSPEKVKILYKLDGFDSQWQVASSQQKRMVFYLNLSPGTYNFKVIACSNTGVWNREGASFKFKIKARFYKQLYFYLLILLLLGILISGIYWLIYTRKQNKDIIKNAVRPREKYSTSALLPETVRQVIPNLTQLMEKEKIFLDSDLTLRKLSRQLNIHYNHLSQIINEHMGKSFNDYINYYRIEEAKKLLTDPKTAGKTILEIAYDTGFYTKSVFNTAFKKFTGMTPSQYKKTGK